VGAWIFCVESWNINPYPARDRSNSHSLQIDKRRHFLNNMPELEQFPEEQDITAMAFGNLHILLL
jgi:hypothetical protein